MRLRPAKTTLSGRLVRIGGLVAILGVAAFTLRSRVPDPAQLGTALSTAHVGFLVLALVAEAVSLRHFALQQRRLLAGYGVGMSIPRAVALTMSRSAISFTLPAGSAVSAGFAFKQFRTAGATRRAAANVTVLSGLLSGGALVVLYGVVMLLPGAAAASVRWTLVFVLGALAAAMLTFAIDAWLSRRTYPPVLIEEHPVAAADTTLARLRAAVGNTLTSLRELPPRTWVLSLLHATVNWATDLACLAATAAAFDLDISVTRLATVYVTVQLVRQVPLSPGGFGVVEVALLAGLVSAGAAQAPAVAAVLVYRLLSCWVIIPVGAVTYGVLRRRTAAPTKAPAAPAKTPAPVMAAPVRTPAMATFPAVLTTEPEPPIREQDQTPALIAS